jgi:hypothetical protein
MDDRLATALALADDTADAPVDTAALWTAGRALHTRRRRTRIAATAVVAVAALVGAGVMAVADDDDPVAPVAVVDGTEPSSVTSAPAPEPTTPTAPTAPTASTAPTDTTTEPVSDRPPRDSGAYTLWLSERRIPATGAVLVAALHNTGGLDATFGVAASVERWDGGTWTTVRRVSVCLAEWHCVGELQPADAPLSYEAIGLAAAPGAVGPTEWLRVEGLEPGWYRLRQESNEGEVATGTFEVVADDVPVIPLGEVAATRLVARPAVIPPGGGRVEVTVSGYGDVGASTAALEAYSETLSNGVVVLRWDGSAWSSVIIPFVVLEPAEPSDRASTVVVDVPPLPVGTYLLGRSLANDAVVSGPLWVTDEAGQTATTLAPPPPDTGPVSLWLSERRIPEAGADVVAVLRNAGAEPVTFGVAASIDHWDGSGWTEVRSFATCLDFWFCTADVDGGSDVLDIGLGADAGRVSEPQWLHVAGLAPGWYRMRQAGNGGEVATGAFEVVRGERVTVPLNEPHADRLSVSPALIPPDGAEISTTVLAWGDGTTGTGGTPTEVRALEAALGVDVLIQRWQGLQWVDTATLVEVVPATTGDGDVLPPPRRYAVPPLPEGAYRAVRTTGDGTEVAGPFWVTADLLGPAG